MKAMTIGAMTLVGMAAWAGASPAAAQANVMKECAAKYQAAKAGGTLPAGQTWLQYLAQCRGGGATATAATKTTAVHTATSSTVTKTNAPVAARTPGQRTPGQIAEVSRQKQCGAQWKADKAADRTGAQTWPQYWSACSKRLKG